MQLSDPITSNSEIKQHILVKVFVCIECTLGSSCAVSQNVQQLWCS